MRAREDLKYPDRIQRIARFLAGARAGWQNAADEARKAAEFLAEKTTPPAPDLATLLRGIWAANDLVEVGRIPFGRLDPAAYDRTVTILLTAAPDPLLKTAPLGAVSDCGEQGAGGGVAAAAHLARHWLQCPGTRHLWSVCCRCPLGDGRDLRWRAHGAVAACASRRSPR